MSPHFTHRELIDQVEFLKRVLKIENTSRGLDLGCGEGVQLKIIQQIARETYGVDKEKSIEIDKFLHLNFFEEQIPLSELDFVYCMAPNFGDDWWNMNPLLQNIYKVLRNDGLFLLDLFSLNSYKDQESRTCQDNIGQHEAYRNENCLVQTSKFYNSKKLEMLIWRIFSKDELIELFAKHNLVLVRDFKGFTDQAANWQPNKQNDRILVLFQKK